jgi:hypothetical protein
MLVSGDLTKAGSVIRTGVASALLRNVCNGSDEIVFASSPTADQTGANVSARSGFVETVTPPYGLIPGNGAIGGSGIHERFS